MATRLVVEWTRGFLRIAWAESKGKQWRLQEVKREPLEPVQTLTERLRSTLASRKTNADTVIAVLPRESVITRVENFPSTHEVELRQMVELYAKAQLPYSREQAVVDYRVLESKNGSSAVMLVASLRERAERCLETLQQVGINAGHLAVSSWGVANWYDLLSQDAAAVTESRLVVHLDTQRTDFVLMRAGKMWMSRSIPKGTSDWNSPTAAAVDLEEEIGRTLSAARKTFPDGDARSLLLTGNGNFETLRDRLRAAMNLSVTLVSADQPFSGWKPKEATAGSIVVAGGLACGDLSEVPNLIPHEQRNRARQTRQVRQLALAGFLLAACIGLGGALLALEVSRDQQIAKHLEQLLAQVSPQAKNLREERRLSEIVDTVVEERKALAGLLAHVIQVTPGAVLLEIVSFDGGRGELSLRGNAPSTQEVLAFVETLEQLEQVGDVTLKYSTQRFVGMREQTDFELVLSPES